VTGQWCQWGSASRCNLGLRPVVNPAVRALTRGRLRHVDAAYLRPETISAANARFIEAQSEIPVVRHWGGGMVVSADGLRFVVPVKSLWSAPNPRYFGHRRGATWLNVVNDQVMGIGGLIGPGTVRGLHRVQVLVSVLGGRAQRCARPTRARCA
jgi:TnpA family transposase